MGASIKSKSRYTGRNYDVGAFRDDHYIRCSRCGWINNMDQAIHSNDGGYEGWGTTFTSVTSTSAGSGFGPHSPLNAGVQTLSPQGQIMYSTSMNSTDTLVNTYGTFSFAPNNSILLSGVASTTGVMLLLLNGNIYSINNSSQWYEYTGSWVTITGDPRKTNTTVTTMDAVVGAGCANCGTLLYTR